MGRLRSLLAISVILSHAGAFYRFRFVGGNLAVESFFIISGFYITLILNEKYIKGNDSYYLFITNRLMRLYPCYWIVLILTFLFACFIPQFDSKAVMGDLGAWKSHSGQLSVFSFASLVFTSIFLFFQDVAMFFGININTGDFFFASNFRLTNPKLYTFLLVPQCWSIGIELAFYLIAPLIVRRKYAIVTTLFLISFIAKIYAMKHGLNFDPWTYRFFPFELMYFLMGTICYFIYKRFVENSTLPKYVYISISSFITIFTVTYSFIHFSHKDILYVLCVFLSIPFLFKYTSKVKTDKFIGELSYPMYITHIFILNVVRMTEITHHANIATIIGSIILSIILVKTVGDRIEKVRQGRVKEGQGVIKVADALSVKFDT